MGRLIKIIVVLALLWCGWWWLAATMVQRGATGWLAERRAAGWQAEVSSLDVAGFPLTLGATAGGITLADPATGVALDASSLTLAAPAYWPGDITLSLPETPLRLVTPDVTLLIKAPGAAADLMLHPGADLQLETLTARSDRWQVNTAQGNLLSGDGFHAEVTQDLMQTDSYRFAIQAQGFTPGDLLRNAVALPADWPLALDALRGDLMVRFERPLDRYTLEDSRPQPREITIQQLDAAWGPLRFNASGRVLVDAAGIPEGEIALRLENWRHMLDLAQGAGILPASQRGQAEFMLSALSNMGGDAETMNVTVAFRQGAMFVGPITFGQAPRLTLR